MVESESIIFSAPPIAALIVKSASILEKWVFITETARRLIAGRSEDSDIYVPERSMSRSHFTIVITKEEDSDGNRSYQIELIDLHSSTGTFVNEQQVQNPIQLQNADIIRVGSTTFRFIWLKDKTDPKQ